MSNFRLNMQGNNVIAGIIFGIGMGALGLLVNGLKVLTSDHKQECIVINHSRTRVAKIAEIKSQA